MRSFRHRYPLALLAGLLVLAAGPLTGASSQTVGEAPNPDAGAKPKGPLAGDGMWIWYLSRSNHGKLGAIAKRAHSRGIETVLIKSGDGTTYWKQFSPSVISGLHARGLRVCAWQYIYG